VLATLVAAAVVFLVFALDATRNVLAELLLAAALACLVRPAVLWLAKRTKMGLALAAIFVGLVIAIGGFLGGEAKAISSGAKQLQHAVPDRIERFQRSLPPGNRLRRFLVEDDFVARVRHNIDGIPSRFILGTDSPARGAGQLGQILLVASLAAFMVTQLPKSINAAVGRLPATSRERAASALRAGYRVGGAYARRTLVLAAACAVVGGLIGWGCGIPGAAVVGLWLGMWALVPKLGIVVGGVPLLALAAGQGTVQLVAATLALAAVLAAGEWSRRRWIERPTVAIGALLSLVAIMIGMELGRWPGVMVTLVAVAVVTAAVDAWRRAPVAQVVPRPSAPVATADTAAVALTSDSGPRRVAVDIDTRSLVLAGAVALSLVVAVGLLASVPQTLTRVAVGVLVALALNSIVGVVQRRLHFNRKGAVSLVVFGFLAVLAAFCVFAVPQAVDQSRTLPRQVPRLVAQLDRAPLVGKTVREQHFDTRVRTFLDDLPHILTTRDKAIESAAKSAGETVLAVCWIFLVFAAALLDGPAIAERVKRDLPPARLPAAERLGNLTYEAVARSAAGSAFSALLQGAVVLVIGLAFGVPLSPILAANAVFWAFVPQVGGLLAALPLILFGLTQGLGTGVAVGVLFLAWMLFNNHVLHAVIVGKAVHISALSSLVAVLVGAALGGFVGAIVATPLVAVVHVLLSSSESDDTRGRVMPVIAAERTVTT
jgi:predicted PurR-regulated permease PerM